MREEPRVQAYIEHFARLARRHPWKVRGLVYLSAFLLPPGVLPPMLMRKDTESILGASLEVDEERKQVRVRKEAARTVFYADCSEEDVARAISLLVPEPLRPRVEEAASRLSVRESEALPRYYIECLQDKALGPSMQRKMYTSLPCQKVYSLPTSHSPFLSAPERLAECLLDIARSQPKRDAHSEASKHPSVASGTDEHEG
ncbi:hypothetical protein EI42_01290 [Thermosporothrix hazakensis]|uniref:Alpha/beta hydrolase family protein n=2 Tax=Thermosporothrix TaxID=768650 RepID=A0A326UML8_THEHA|nr:hypothetical protein [Thermosporothrix hazakensis]PZW34453.1 hypothetical protein EI42_01290 [Thermosporothrix hazakensis]BBH85576.1 hypothetical protein KTC_03270 [Thermosporothrix sp. COM3]GCE45997.1 hypothetical protein KTH_08660 [Thermosporothrix hazakensis]